MLLVGAGPLATSAQERVGPAPMDVLFVDPSGIPRLPVTIDAIPPGVSNRLAPAMGIAPYVAGFTDTILRATGHIEDFNVGLRVALDRDQMPNPVVAGYYYRPANNEFYNGVLVKFDGQGEMAYQAGVHIGQFEVLYGVGIDGSNNAIGGGYIFNQAIGRYQMLAAKVNSDGVLQWTRSVAADPTSIYNLAFDASVDSAGNAVLAGISLSPSFDYDAAAVKLDPDGNVLWAKRFAVPGFEYILGATSDSAGNTLMAGYTFTTTYVGVVYKLDPNGNLIFRRTVDLGGNAIPYSIAAAPDGSFFLGGYAFSNTYQGLVARVAPDGTTDWVIRINSGTFTIGTDIATDGAGNAVLGGYGFNADLGQYDAFVAKVTPQGVVLFTRLIDGIDGATFNIAYGVATSQDGLFIATGGYTLRGNGYDIESTKSLGVSAVGAVGGALATATNVQNLL